MAIFKRLWQRIFVYSLILLVFLGAVGSYLVHANLSEKASAVVLAFTEELSNTLRGQASEHAHELLQRINNQEAKFWLEDSEGNLVAGQRFAGKAGKDWAVHLKSVQHSGDVALWHTNIDQPAFIAIVPCSLRGNDCTLYAAYMSFPVPPLETFLSPGVITLLLATGLLALWIAIRVGRPLRRLQKEVALSSDSPTQLQHVTVTGCDEIADVASAINRLVDSLHNHVGGMNHLVMNVSHELRSPLARMTFSTEMIGAGLARCMENRDALSEQDRATLQLAQKNFVALEQELELMNKLIGDTLFASKLGLQDSCDMEPVNLSSLCVSVSDRFLPLFRQSGVRVIRSIEQNAIVPGDETLLQQLTSNLLDNARKYVSGPEPIVRLRLQRKDDKILMTLENSHAAQLSPHTLEHIFDPYFRHEQKAGTGIGLGLSIVKQIVTIHNGSITASNTDNGIAFHLELPLGV